MAEPIGFRNGIESIDAFINGIVKLQAIDDARVVNVRSSVNSREEVQREKREQMQRGNEVKKPGLPFFLCEGFGTV